jgi:hypothetical protein
LARALLPFSASLAQYASIREEREGKEERERGIAWARKMGQKAAQMVRSGKLPAHESAWFLYGVREQVGRVASQQYETHLAVQMAQSPVTNGYDIGAFEEFLGQTRNEFMNQQFAGSADEAVMAGFVPRADAIDANARSHFGGVAAKNIETEALQQTTVEARGVIQEARRKGAEPEETGRNLSLLLDRHIANGADKRLANQAVIGAVAESALIHRDMSVFNVLTRVPTSPGNTLANDPGLPAIKQQTAEAIQQNIEQQTRWLKWLEDQERAKTERQLYSTMTDVAINPETNQQLVDVRVFMDLANKTGNPLLAPEIPGIWRKLLDTGVPDNPEAFRDLLLQMTEADFGPSNLAYALASGDISSGQYIELGRLQKTAKDMPEGHRAMLTRALRLLGDEYAKEGTPSWEDLERRRRMRFAQEQLEYDFLREHEAGTFTDLPESQIRKWMAEASERILLEIPITDRRRGWLDGHIRSPFVAPPPALRPNVQGTTPMTEEYHTAIVNGILADPQGRIRDPIAVQALTILTQSTDPIDHYRYLGLESLAETYKKAKETAAEKERAESMERRIP